MIPMIPTYGYFLGYVMNGQCRCVEHLLFRNDAHDLEISEQEKQIGVTHKFWIPVSITVKIIDNNNNEEETATTEG